MFAPTRTQPDVMYVPDANAPLIVGSAISDTYIGAYTQYAPPPIPPMNLPIIIVADVDENSIISQQNCKKH